MYALIFYAIDKKWLPPTSMTVAGPIVFVLWLVGIAATVWYDKVRRLTVLFYDLDQTTASAYDSFVGAFNSMAKVDRLWAIGESVRYSDTKYHAGANTGVKRSNTSISFGAPANVRCNISVPMMTCGGTQLALFPDRALAFQGRRVGAVPYSQIAASITRTQFREEEGVPHDTQVIGQTWKFVNRGGGPDKRFKNNRQIPVCSYSEVELRSPAGLSMCFLASRPGTFDPFPKAIELLATLEKSSAVAVTHRAA